MHKMTYQKSLLPLQGLTGWKPINIKSEKKKMCLKGKILPILSCFLFLFAENMIEYWYPRKTIQGQKYIKLADIATLTLHTVYPVTPNTGMFNQRGCKHLRRGNTQGKKTCNLRISIVPNFNITYQTLCKRAFL